MGFWNDGIRSPSPSRRHGGSSNGGERYSSRPSASRSASSFNLFGGSSGSRSRGYSSRARPRSGFVNKIRRWLRELYSYMRQHPMKVFILVIMPLITGGALAKMLATVGVRLPPGLSNMIGGAAGRQTRTFARGGARDFEGGSALPGMMGGGLGESLGGVMGIAKMFL